LHLSLTSCATTALVIPNAIRVQTAQRTFHFRTLLNRAETFREIVKLLPDKSVVSQDDDVDEKTRKLFRLEASDTILAMYSANWHHDPGFTEGKVLFTTQHLLFISNGDASSRRRKIAWAEVRNIEKRKSFLVRNNAVFVTTDTSSIFLSSSKWDRDKVVDEEMAVLWRGGHQALRNQSAASAEDDSHQFANAGVRCRTLTCSVVEALKTPRNIVNRSAAGGAAGGAASGAQSRLVGDPAMEYERQLQRSRDAVTFTVSVIDCKTLGRGVDRHPGNPCVIELHAPWILENLTCSNLEVQLVDKTRCVIARTSVSQGASRQVTSVDLRRELRLRARILRRNVGGSNEYGPWSALVSMYSTQDLETESFISLPDITGDGSQEVVVEVTQDSVSCGFRVCLYNKFWMLNLSGLRVEGRDQGAENMATRLLPLGAPIGWDGGEGLQFRVPGYGWSQQFAITDQSEQNATIALTSSDLPGCGVAGGEGANSQAGVRELNLELSTSPGIGRFDRTIVATIAPLIVVENCLRDDVVVWQRATPALPSLSLIKGPRVTLAPGETRPLHPEGIRKYCRLSLNLKADGVHESCASFAPEVWWGRDGGGSGVGGGGGSRSSESILLRMTCGRMVVLSSEVNRANTVLLSVRDAVGAAAHGIYNQTYFSLDFRQVGDNLKRLVHVEPWQETPLVWPEPTDLPHKLVLAKIDGVAVPRSSEVECDDLMAQSINLFHLPQQISELRRALHGGSVPDDHVPRQLAMDTDAQSSAVVPHPRETAVRHDGRWLDSTLCVNGAVIWHDRDGISDRRAYRLRNVPRFLLGSSLFQLPCRLVMKSPVELFLSGRAKVFVLFVAAPRDGGLPEKLLGIGWKQEAIPGVNNYFDWDGKVGNPENDRFVRVLSKRFTAAATLVLPAHSGETIMGLAVRSEEAEQHEAAAERVQRPTSWRGSRYVLRLKDPGQYKDADASGHDSPGVGPLLIELTGSRVVLADCAHQHDPAALAEGCKVVKVQGLEGCGPVELSVNEDGSGWCVLARCSAQAARPGLCISNEPVTTEAQLRHGDVLRITAPSVRNSRRRDGVSSSGFEYVFEDYVMHSRNVFAQACSLRTTTRLNPQGTKVVHVHSAALADNASALQMPTKSQSTYSMAAPALNVVLEDDVVASAADAPDSMRKEEVLFLSMQSIKASVLSDGASRQLIAQVLGLQMDNQVRCLCSFGEEAAIISCCILECCIFELAISHHLCGGVMMTMII